MPGRAEWAEIDMSNVDKVDLPSGPKRVKLINSTLRDGAQAVWSGRLREREILPIVYTLDNAGYEAIDLMAPVQFEVCVKHLQENPWMRARAVRGAAQKTPLFTHLRSRSLTSFDLVHDSIFDLWVERIAATGFRRVMVFDALHDANNLRTSTQRAKAAGLHVCLVLFYTVSPFHTREYYAQKAKELASYGADSVCIRDPSGLLTPDEVRKLVPVVRAGIGNMPLYLKSHATTGQAEDCYIEAARQGVDALFVSSEPLANGASVPSVRRVATRLEEMGIETGVDIARVIDEENYFYDLAKRTDRPLSRPVEKLDSTQINHQIPGNMIAFTQGQLADMKAEHLLPQVLEEFVRVRADMGFPVMVTPVSQLVCVQAVLNVIQKERYKSVPNEVARYVLGHYGAPEAPIAPELLERVTPQAPSDVAEVDPVYEARQRYGSSMTDDDLLLHMLFRGDQLAGIPFDTPPEKRPARKNDIDGLVNLIKECAKLPVASVHIEKAGAVFSARRRRSVQTGTE